MGRVGLGVVQMDGQKAVLLCGTYCRLFTTGPLASLVVLGIVARPSNGHCRLGPTLFPLWTALLCVWKSKMDHPWIWQGAFLPAWKLPKKTQTQTQALAMQTSQK